MVPVHALNVAIIDLDGTVNSRSVNYYHGLVEIYNSKKSRYEYICDEGWDINDAHVVCRMLGFPGAIDATVRSEYGEPHLVDISMSNVECNGTEDSIFDCPHQSYSNCSRSRSAGVQCLGTYSHTHYKYNNVYRGSGSYLTKEL